MSKECEKAALYFYGEMTREEAAAFKTHAAACPRCKEELAFLTRMQEALVPPAAPARAVEKALPEVVSAQSSPRRRWLFKPVFAALLLAALGLWCFVSGPFAPHRGTGQTWLAYVSEEADREYTAFAAEFEAFENQF